MNDTPIKPKVMIETCGQGSALGKSFVAEMTYVHAMRRGEKLRLIHVEAQRERTKLRQLESVIGTETFAEIADTPGGAVGALGAFFTEVGRVARDGGTVVLDWGAGQSAIRADAYAMSELGDNLSEHSVQAFSIIVTTRDLDRMRESINLVHQTRVLLPDTQIILVANEIAGRFSFAENSVSAKVCEQLMELVGLPNVSLLQKITGDAMKTLAPAQLTLEELILADADELAEKLGVDEFIVRACLNRLAQAFDVFDKKLERVLPFHDA